MRGVGPIGAWIQTEGPPRTAALPPGVKLMLLVDNREVRTQTDRTYMQVRGIFVARTLAGLKSNAASSRQLKNSLHCIRVY